MSVNEDQTPRLHNLQDWESASWRLGANFDEESGVTTFGVYAPMAEHVTLEIFLDPIGAEAILRVDMAKSYEGVWRASLLGAGHGTYYGYRCWGKNWPYLESWRPGTLEGFQADRDEYGNHFNPNKVLLDPYALEVSHTPMNPKLEEMGFNKNIFGTGSTVWEGKQVRELDSAKWAPKGIVVSDRTDTGQGINREGQDICLYEVHVKQLTMHPSASKLEEIFSDELGFDEVKNVPEELRGTYAGAAYMAPYLKALNINTIEFLPVHETDSDQVGDNNGSTNNWGYQTLNFFSPNRDYSSDKSPGGPTREFKEMVRTFHEHGIGVFIDVVFNHTAEGGNWDADPNNAGFTTFGGFGTAEYYDLAEGGAIHDAATGSGNQTNFSSPGMCSLTADSLKYWHEAMGVDGFRFDLAPVLGRMPELFDESDWAGRKRFFRGHPLLTRIGRKAKENNFRVVAEAWDLWGYEVGNFPAEWGEWNGRYRDAIRCFLKGDGNTSEFINVFNGDWAGFGHKEGPNKSINFVTAHDGFTMMDLVSFNAKDNNQEYPFGPSDGGSDNNNSWDSGGDLSLRRTRWRNFIVTLFFSRGVPMIVGGDEFGRTQNGNNNPWNLNTVGVWNNWAQAASNAPTQVPVDPRDETINGYYDVIGQTAAPEKINPLFRFTRYVARLRSLDPTLRQPTWGNGELHDDDVTYLFFKPDLSGAPEEGDRAVCVLIDGKGIGGSEYLFMLNMSDSNVDFDVPEEPDPNRPQLKWFNIIDTGDWAEEVSNFWVPSMAMPIEGNYTVEPWSIAVLVAADQESPLFHNPDFDKIKLPKPDKIFKKDRSIPQTKKEQFSDKDVNDADRADTSDAEVGSGRSDHAEVSQP